MLPKWHVLFGFLFAYIIYWFTSITVIDASLIFLSSVLIDLDHYLWIAKRKKYFNLKKAYCWHKSLPLRHKPIMHIFHTIEFLLFVLILGLFFKIFFFIFIGMLFHSILDVIDMVYNKKFRCREFSFVKYLVLNKRYPDKYF